MMYTPSMTRPRKPGRHEVFFQEVEIPVMSNGKIRRTDTEWQEILSQWRKSEDPA
jgi:hypothetical protein